MFPAAPIQLLPRAAQWLTYLALLTIGWDRFFSVMLGGYNVKLPLVLFAAALATSAVAIALRDSKGPHYTLARSLKSAPLFTAFLAVVLLSVLWMIIASLMAQRPGTAFIQTGATLVGALLPFAAILAAMYLRGAVLPFLNAFIVGAGIASAFGIYQLVAIVTGLPQIVEYEALGGGLPRISSFLYEAGYFGYYLVLAAGAVIARARIIGRYTWREITALAVFVIVVLLANTRAVYLTLPIFAVLLCLRHLPMLARHWKITAAVVVSVTGVLAALAWLIPGTFAFLTSRFTSIFDPTEESSNAPRLQWAGVALDISRDYPLFGIGPGHLFYLAPEYGGNVTGGKPNSIIANNAYLQALLDGGIPLLVLQCALIVLFVAGVLRSKNSPARGLLYGWISSIAVAFMITSFFWDLKIWAIIALAFGCVMVQRSDATPSLEPTPEPARP